MKVTLKNHWGVLVLAFIIGFLIVLPNLVSIAKVGDSFKGVYPMFNDDESYYLAITKEVYDGNVNSGNSFLKEHKNSPAMQPLFFEILPAYEAKLLGLSVPQVFVLNDFILPFIGVLFLYILFFLITGSKYISNTFSFLFYFLFLFSFNRPISPQFGFLFFILGIILIWKIICKENVFKEFLFLNIFLGIIFGSLIYIYPFYWTSIILLYFLSTIFILIKDREFKYWLKNYAIFILASLPLVILYGLDTIKLAKNPYFIESSLRNGLVFTHWPGAFFNVVFLLICLPIIYLLSPYFKKNKKLLFCYSIVFCGVILNWQNIITGKILQFSSHYYMVSIFFIFLILSIILKNVLDKGVENNIKKSKKFLGFFLIIILIILISYKQRGDMLGAFKIIFSPINISEKQDVMLVADWLNKNTPKDSSVYTLGSDYEVFIPVYTKNNLYRSGYSGMSLISDDELENRWVVEHFWDNVSEDMVVKSQRSIWINEFQDTYANKEVRRKIIEFITRKKYTENILVDPEHTNRVLEKYSKFKKEGFEKSLKNYDINYILLDSKDPRYSNLPEIFKKYPFVELTRIGNVIIYKVN